MKNLLILLFIFFLISCSKPINPKLQKAQYYERKAILAYRYNNRLKAIKRLKRSLKLYALYDNIPKEVDILLLLAKIDKKNSKKYLNLAKSFFDNVDQKRKEDIKFTIALLNKDIKKMKTLSNIAQSDKIKALAKIYLFKWTKNKKFIKNFSYNKKNYIYSFYLYEKSKFSNIKTKIALLNKALQIDKKMQNIRFIKRDLLALFNTYISIDRQKALQIKKRLELMND